MRKDFKIDVCLILLFFLFLAFNASAEILVDDFEGALNWTIEKNPTSLNATAEIVAEAYNGTGAMKIMVEPSTEGYAYAQFIKKTPESEAWRGFDGISFWVKGNVTSPFITLRIYAGGYEEQYDYGEIMLDDDQWRKIDIPWGNFRETTDDVPLDLEKTSIDDIRFVKIGQWNDTVEMIIDEMKVVNFSGSGSVVGKVTNALDKPIEGVSVKCGGNEAETDENGDFILINVPSGTRELVYSRRGYMSQQEMIEIINSDTTRADCVLESDPVIDNFDQSILDRNWVSEGNVDVQMDHTSESYAGAGALKVKFDAAPTGGYARLIYRQIDTGGAWMPFDGISFWLKPKQPTGSIVFQINTDGFENEWNKQIDFKGTDWQEVVIPWGEFKEGDDSLNIVTEVINDIRWMAAEGSNNTWSEPIEFLLDEIQLVSIEFEHELNGRVVNVRGLPVIGAEVEVEGVSTFTDSEGYYSLDKIPSGSIAVKVSKAGYLPKIETIVFDDQVPAMAYNILLEYDNVVDDFEGAFGWVIEKSPKELNVTAGKVGEAYSGTSAMKITVEPSTEGYAYAQFIKKAPESDAWNESDGISFWVKGNGTSQSITFSVRAGGYEERYDYGEIALVDGLWHKVDIPWKQCHETSTGEALDLKKTIINDMRFVKIGQWNDRVEMIIDDIRTIMLISSITGSVVNSKTKMPICGSSVCIGVLELHTNEEGFFNFEKIAAGGQVLRVTAPGYKEKQFVIDGIEDYQSINLFVELDPTYGIVEGKLTDDSGIPLEGAVVSSGTSFSFTDSQGMYKLLNVQCGDVEVTASKEGYRVETKVTAVDEKTNTRLDFLLFFSDDTDIPASVEGLEARGDVAGRIHLLWTPIDDEETYLYNIYRTKNSLINPIEDVPCAMLVKAVNASWIDEAVAPNEEYFYSVVRVGINGKHSLPSEKVSASTRRPLGKIHGKITDSEGEPLPGVLVRVKDYWTYTDSSGNYELVIPLGGCIVQISKEPFVFRKINTIVETDGVQKEINVSLELGQYPDTLAILGAMVTPKAIRPSGKYNQTFISFALAQPALITVEVYSPEGIKIVSLAENIIFSEGYHYLVWDGLDKNSKTLPNGIYLVYIRAQEPNGPRFDVAKIAIGVFGR